MLDRREDTPSPRPSYQTRLATQLESLDLLLAGADGGALAARSPSGQWSALENLAHLGRYHEIFLERLERIIDEERPRFARYRAEEDPEWAAWTTRPVAEVRRRLAELRALVVARTAALSPAELARTGVHPLFGEMTVPRWIEFFLAHEGHHLYTMLLRLSLAARR